MRRANDVKDEESILYVVCLLKWFGRNNLFTNSQKRKFYKNWRFKFKRRRHQQILPQPVHQLFNQSLLCEMEAGDDVIKDESNSVVVLFQVSEFAVTSSINTIVDMSWFSQKKDAPSLFFGIFIWGTCYDFGGDVFLGKKLAILLRYTLAVFTKLQKRKRCYQCVSVGATHKLCIFKIVVTAGSTYYSSAEDYRFLSSPTSRSLVYTKDDIICISCVSSITWDR
ncbi:hypothetical protein Bca4012_020058 [Brassica carinata]